MEQPAAPACRSQNLTVTGCRAAYFCPDVASSDVGEGPDLATTAGHEGPRPGPGGWRQGQGASGTG
jgi:hypothetical protein